MRVNIDVVTRGVNMGKIPWKYTRRECEDDCDQGRVGNLPAIVGTT